MRGDISEIILVANAAKKTKKVSITKATDAVTKSYQLTKEERDLVESCLIEYETGISHPTDPYYTPYLVHTPDYYLVLYKEAVTAKGECPIGGGCSPTVAAETIGGFICRQMM